MIESKVSSRVGAVFAVVLSVMLALAGHPASAVARKSFRLSTPNLHPSLSISQRATRSPSSAIRRKMVPNRLVSRWQGCVSRSSALMALI